MSKKTRIIYQAMLVAWDYEHGLTEPSVEVPHDLSFEQAIARVEEWESDQQKISEQEYARVKKQARHANIRFWRLIVGIGLSLIAYLAGYLPWPLCVVAIATVVVIDLIDMEGE